MRRLAIIPFLLCVFIFITGFDGFRVGDGFDVGDGFRIASPGMTAYGIAGRDTQTWVFASSFEGAASSSGDYPAAPDSVVTAGFRYAEIAADTETTHSYSESRNRSESSYGFDPSHAAVRHMLWHWGFEDIPDNVTILSATLYAYVLDIDGQSDIAADEFVIAALDTSTVNATRATGSSLGGNAEVMEVSWNYSDVSLTTAWETDFDDRDEFSDWGYLNIALEAGGSIGTNAWSSFDLTRLVDTYHEQGLSDKLIWLMMEYNPAGRDLHVSCGPNAAVDEYSPFVVVEFVADNRTRAGYQFLAFSDNHARASFYTEDMDSIVTALSGTDIVDMVIHLGDQNYLNTLEHAWTKGQITETFGASVPLIMVTGNHEASTSNDTEMQASLAADNQEFWDEATAVGYQPASPGQASYRWNSFSFDRGDAHFVVFDPSTFTDPDTWIAANDSTWLYNDLASSEKPLKVIFMHVPPWRTWDRDTGYTTASSCFADSVGIRAIAQATGVDAIIGGHHHKLGWSKIDGIWHVTIPTSQADPGDFEEIINQGGFCTFTVSPGGGLEMNTYRKLASKWQSDYTVSLTGDY